jgi:hypothetical protein
MPFNTWVNYPARPGPVDAAKRAFWVHVQFGCTLKSHIENVHSAAACVQRCRIDQIKRISCCTPKTHVIAVDFTSKLHIQSASVIDPLRGRLHGQFRVQIGVRLGLRFAAQGG